jgi:hypothetical protein
VSGSADERPATAEATATVYQEKPCRHCGGPVVAPKRRGIVKDFCSDKHRAAFRDHQVAAAVQEAQRAIEDTKDAIEDTRSELARLEARLTGARQLLEQAVPRRLRAAAQPDGESTEGDRKGLQRN